MKSLSFKAPKPISADELIAMTPTRNLSCKVGALKLKSKPFKSKDEALKAIRLE
jgi:hypothetical protein